MTYEKMDPIAAPFLFVYSILVILCAIMTYLLYRKWMERKREANRLITLTFLSYLISFIILLSGYLEMYITGEKREIYRLSLGLTYAGLCISNIILSYFIAEIFGLLRKDIRKYTLVNIIIIILVLLPWNDYGVPSDEIQFPIVRPITNVLLIIWCIILFYRIARSSFNMAKKSENPVALEGFRLIGWSHVMLVLFLIFTALDTLYFTIMETGGYSPLLYIAYFFCLMFFLICYLGFIMPDWLRNRILKKHPQSPNKMQ